MEDDERPRVTGNSAPSFERKYQQPQGIHKLRYFFRKWDWKMLFSLSTIMKFRTEIIFVVWPPDLSGEVRKSFYLKSCKVEINLDFEEQFWHILKTTLRSSQPWNQPWLLKRQFLHIFKSTLISRQLEFFSDEQYS